MIEDLHWKTDPVVVLEGCILPVLSAGPELLCALLMSDQHPPDEARLTALLKTFAVAEQQLRNGGAQFLDPVGIKLDARDLAECVAVADLVVGARQLLDSAVDEFRCSGEVLNGDGRRIADYMAYRMTPGVNDALDVFRRVFIGSVLERQVVHARQAEIAINQLSEIGETIFYIAVNASIEAARVGDLGRGFAVIGEDIRHLSQRARAATSSLGEIMNKSA